VAATKATESPLGANPVLQFIQCFAGRHPLEIRKFSDIRSAIVDESADFFSITVARIGDYAVGVGS